MKKQFYSVLLAVCIAVLLLGGCDEQKPEEEAGPDSSFHVYIAFGQSNMQGPGEIRTQDKTFEHYDRWRVLNVVKGIYGATTVAAGGIDRAKGEWYDAIPPLIISGSLVNYLSLNIGLGPSDYFGRTLVEKIVAEDIKVDGEDVKVGIVAVANGDWALASFRKDKAAEYYNTTNGNGTNGKENNRPSSTERDGWTRYKNAGYESPYDAIITNAKIAQEAGGTIKGIIVHQGESGRGLTDITWEQMLKEIYNDMLNDLELKPNSIPILLGQTFNAGKGPGGYLNPDNVLMQKVIPKAYVISSAGLNTGRPSNDNIHFGSDDLEKLGTRYGEKMWDLIYK